MHKAKINILIIEDDPFIRLAIRDVINEFGPISEAATLNEARSKLKSETFQIAILDMHLGDESGIELISLLKSHKTHVIIMSSEDDEAIIEKAYLKGADHYLSKRQFTKSLKPAIERFLQTKEESYFENFFHNDFVTQDNQMRSKILDICHMDLKNKAVLITGETGVGKTHIAKLFHQMTYSNQKPFIHLNCSEVPENLIESELFGYQKGAFTGATENKIGKLQLANGGTLFLDEVGTMPIIMQQKLLKAIEEKVFYPLGSTQMQKSEFTLITATCDDLFEKIANKEFRKDFFFRISGINLEISPLRFRKNDIGLLIKRFLKEQDRKIIIKEDAMEALINNEWSGNTRELKKYIELLCSKNKGVIYKNDLHQIASLTSNSENELISPSQEEFIIKNGLRNYINYIESHMVKKLMAENKGKITTCIEQLQISNSSFYRILNDLK
jgi:DNA-binding NtrC family response regulator